MACVAMDEADSSLNATKLLALLTVSAINVENEWPCKILIRLKT